MIADVTEPLAHFVDTVLHASRLTYAAVGVGFIVAIFFFRLFFGDFSGFLECLRYWSRPDIISLFRGEWEEDRWSELKLFIWAALSAGSGILAYYELPHWFPKLFPA